MPHEQHTSRRRLTPLVVDALLVSLVVVLAMNATFFLRYGDLHWDPWYERAVDPIQYLFTFPPALFGVWIARRLNAPPFVAIVAGLIGGWAGSLLAPELAVN